MRKLLFVSILLILSTLTINAQEYAVKPIASFTTEYQGKHSILLNYIESRTDLNLQQRLTLYGNELNKLKNEFRSIRKLEYSDKQISLSVAHSCSKGSSGGVKDCGWNSVSAPIVHLYTTTAWISVEGTNKGTMVDESGTTASLHMTRASQGVNKGTLTAIFRYRPESILSLLEKDTTELFEIVCK